MGYFNHRLRIILENNDDLLDIVVDFDGIEDWWPPEIEDPEEAAAWLTNSYTKEPPPGVSPINAKVLSIRRNPKSKHKEIAITKVRMTIRDFIKHAIELDEDPYLTLQHIKDNTDDRTTAAAHQYMQDPNNGLKVARLGKSDNNELDADQWPASINL